MSKLDYRNKVLPFFFILALFQVIQIVINSITEFCVEEEIRSYWSEMFVFIF